jgi:hypothetical protein
MWIAPPPATLLRSTLQAVLVCGRDGPRYDELEAGSRPPIEVNTLCDVEGLAHSVLSYVAFAKRPNPLVGFTLPAPGLTLPAPGSMAPAANQGHAQDLAQKPAIGSAGGVMRNAIGVAMQGRSTAVQHVSAPFGVRPLPGAMSTAMHASSEHGPATNAVGAPLIAANASPRDARLSTCAANQNQAFQANHVVLNGGPAVNGATMAGVRYRCGRRPRALRRGRAQWLKLPAEVPLNSTTASPGKHR